MKLKSAPHRGLALLWILLRFTSIAQAQWITFNDHAPGPGTHPNSTRYHILGDGNSMSGTLKNVLNGLDLTATLSLSWSGQIIADAIGVNPAEGTPLFNAFQGYVDFAGSPSPNVILGPSGVVTYTITGLNPDRSYHLYTSAVRGNTGTTTNRWTLVELAGAESFMTDHSAGALTTTQLPVLTVNQVAVNTGANHTPDSGDLAGWTAIKPGPDGAIQIISSRFSGTLPNGLQSGTVAYAPTGLRLEEVFDDTTVYIQSQPKHQVVLAGETATFSVLASGSGLSYQWLRNGESIPGADGTSYRLTNVLPSDSGTRFLVVISNPFGEETSKEAVLIVPPPTLTPLPWDQEWRYEVSGTDLGTGWREVDFDDSAWPSGPGVLGFETATLAEPIRTTFPNNNQLTYYFRTSFVLTNNLGHYELTLRALIDDGAMFYLNGQEWFRTRMPTGTIGFGTFANATVGDAVVEERSIQSGELNPGTNWLAVEVHQSASNSSDLVLGLSIIATPIVPTELSITSQPQGQALHQYQPLTLSVGVEGDVVNYRWFKDNEPIANADGPELTIPQVAFDDAGIYVVAVSNLVSFLVSDPVEVMVGDPVPVQVTQSPQDQTTLVAEPVSFTVEVTGDTPYYFQWWKDGLPVREATNQNLTFNHPHLPDAGVYTLSLSNNFSDMISEPATLSVLRHPRGEPGSLHQDFVGSVEGRSNLPRGMVRQRNGDIILGTTFGLNRFSQDGLVDENFHPELDGSIYSLLNFRDGMFFVGFVGASSPKIALFKADGSINHDFDAGSSVPSRAWDLALQTDGKVIAVGGGANGEFYRFHPDGTLDFSDINPDSNVGGGGSFYYAVAVQPDGKILLGGRFRAYHGQEDYRHLMRWQGDGTLDNSFLAGTNAPNGYVYSIVTQGDKILVGGGFTSIAGETRTGIARLEQDGRADPTFHSPQFTTPSFGPAVEHILVQPDGAILITGIFNSADGVPMGGVARLHPDGTLDTRLNVWPGTDQEVRKAAIDLNGDIYLAGYFTNFNGEPHNAIAKIYGTGEPILDFQSTESGALEILWPGDREGLLLESATAPTGEAWNSVTEPATPLNGLNATTIDPTNRSRLFRLRIPAE